MPETETKSDKQRIAEADVEGFREDLGPFVVAAETTRMPMVFTNAKARGHPIVFANDSFLSLTGYDRDEVLGQSFMFIIAPEADPAVLDQVEAVFGDGCECGLEFQCRRKDGRLFRAALFVSPVRDEADDVVQHFASLVDLSRHQREEDHLRFLLDELNHRTQNTLATVQAIAAQTFRGATNTEMVAAFEGRILALSKAHSLLGRENWKAITLRDVLDQILQPFGLGDGRVTRFTLTGGDIRLQPKTALTLAMVFHELATNAAKYGALSRADAGRIDIAWWIERTAGEDQMTLRWQETGGPPVKPPSRKGFGTRLIEGGLAQELNGAVRLDYEPTGVVCQIVMPAPKAGDEP